MLDELFMQILDMSKTAGIVIAAVMLARLLLRKAPKWISYALWAVVLVRLLCPMSIPAPVSIVPEVPSVAEEYTLADEPISFAGAGVAAYQAMGDALNGGLGVQQVPTTERDESGMVRYVTADWGSVWILFGQYVWVLGVAAMAVYSAISYGQLRRRLRVTLPLRENIFIADDIKSPFVIGLAKPKIYLPCGLGEAEREYIILHEQYHIRRLDHIVKALAFLALTLHWFNPLVWAAFVLACRDMEMSCDEAVIGQLGENIRADYSASLLSLATGRRIITGTPLAFGEGDTRGRIKNLANWRKPAFWVIAAAVTACIVLAVCLVTDPPGEDVGNEVMEDFIGKILAISESTPYCYVEVTDSGSSDLAVGDNVFVHTVIVGGSEVIGENSQIVVGDYIEVFFNGVVQEEVAVSMARARIPVVFRIEKTDQIVLEPEQQELPGETVQRIVNSILVGALSDDDEDWQSNGNYTISVFDGGECINSYMRAPTDYRWTDNTPGHATGNFYTWTPCEDEGEDGGYSITFDNGICSFTVYSGNDRIKLTEHGETMYFSGHYQYPGPDVTDVSSLFQRYSQYAESAVYEQGMRACTVDGHESDYAVIAQKLTELYAGALRARPAWHHQRAQDAIAVGAEMFDAYYGGDDPNFCFVMRLYLKVDDDHYWQAGAGIDPLPDGSDYEGYYSWSREACVQRGEDGNWYLEGLNTGGSSVRLPVAPDEATVQQLMEMYFLTDGFTHEYLLLNYLAEKPVDEVLAQLDALEDEQRAALRAAILKFIEEYPDYTTWTAEDFA